MVLLNEQRMLYEVHYQLFEQIERVDDTVPEDEDTEDDQPVLSNASGFV